METLQKLERCEGHLLNWYNTRTLEPLQPQYVSTVDSGNLIASLWVLGAGLSGDGSDSRNWRTVRFEGLADTLAVVIERFPPDHTTAIPLETLARIVPGRIVRH